MKMTYMIDIYNLYEVIYFILFCTSFPGFIILVHYSKSAKLIKDIGKLLEAVPTAATVLSGVDAASNLSNKYKGSNNSSNSNYNSKDDNSKDDNSKDDKNKDYKNKDKSNDYKNNTKKYIIILFFFSF